MQNLCIKLIYNDNNSKRFDVFVKTSDSLWLPSSTLSQVIVTSIIAMSTIIKSFVDKEPQNTYNSFFFSRVIPGYWGYCGKMLEIRLDEEGNIRINMLLSYYSLRELGSTLWKGSTRVIARYAATILFIGDPIYIILYSINERLSTHRCDQTCNHFSTLTCTYLRVKFSIRALFEWKSKSTHQFTFPIYVKITSVCVTNSFLICYVTYQTMTYHENKKVRCIAVEIISRFFFPATSKKLWLCFQCGKRYMWKDSLKKHLRVECGKEPTYECPICGRKFKHKHRWQSHARLIHYLDIWPTKQARV